ncbi:MAG: hypothetical protein KatS3mg107_1266 [Gemmataceae bacterium]|nr:MAG: hypothetical protein KatS3mg107_1266 [Gemmataceae bacterium]
MTLVTFGFPTTYVAEEQPYSRPSISFHSPKTQTAQEGLVLETASGPKMRVKVITGQGEVWVGEFEPGPGGLTGIFATPCPDDLCVVNAGYAYRVPTLTPEGYEFIPAIPVKDVVRVPGKDILVFVDYVRLTAIGPAGLLWQSPDVSWDGIRLVEVSSASIRGLGWDSPANREVEFVVDAETGHTQGGSSPTHYNM